MQGTFSLTFLQGYWNLKKKKIINTDKNTVFLFKWIGSVIGSGIVRFQNPICQVILNGELLKKNCFISYKFRVVLPVWLGITAISQ